MAVMTIDSQKRSFKKQKQTLKTLDAYGKIV